MRRRAAKTIGIAALLVLGMAGASDASTDGAAVSDGGGFPECDVLGSSPASGSWTESSSGFGSSSASAAADAGVLGGIATATANGNSVSSTNSITACFYLESVIDDVIISGPDSMVTLQVSADVGGWVDLDAINGSWAVANTFANIQIGEVMESGIFFYSSTIAQITPGYTAPTSTSIDTTLTTVAITLPTSSTFVVRLKLAAFAHATDNLAAGTSNATIDFSPGMGFPSSGPIFTLPAGFTANSVDGGIVDNQLGSAPQVPAMGGPAIVALATLLASLGAAKLSTSPSREIVS